MLPPGERCFMQLYKSYFWGMSLCGEALKQKRCNQGTIQHEDVKNFIATSLLNDLFNSKKYSINKINAVKSKQSLTTERQHFC